MEEILLKEMPIDCVGTTTDYRVESMSLKQGMVPQTCPYCQEQIPEKFFVSDHFIPKRFEKNGNGNMIRACWHCNSVKGKRVFQTIVDVRKHIREHWRKLSVSRKKTLSKCITCGTSFEVHRPWQRFCSDRCRIEQWQREHPRVYRAVLHA